MKKCLIFAILVFSFAKNIAQKTELIIIDVSRVKANDTTMRSITIGTVCDTASSYCVTVEVAVPVKDFPGFCKLLISKGQKIDTSVVTQRNLMKSFLSVEESKAEYKYFAVSPSISFIDENHKEQLIMVPIDEDDVTKITELKLMLIELKLRLNQEVLIENVKNKKTTNKI